MLPNPTFTGPTNSKPELESAGSMFSSASDVKIEESRLNNVAGNMIVVTINSSPSSHQGDHLRDSQSVLPLYSRNIKVEDPDIKFEDSTKEHDTKVDDDSSSSGQGHCGHVRFLSTSHVSSNSSHSKDVKNEDSIVTCFNIKSESSIHDMKPSVDLSTRSPSETKPDVDGVRFFPFEMEEALPHYHTHATCTVVQITPKTSIPRMYSRLMFIHELGYPLYIPEPNRSSKAYLKEYRKKGIRIGDVGTVTDTGSFDFLFNACYPADHPVNPDVLPDDYEPLITVDDLVMDNFGAETLLLSKNVKQTKNLPVTYQCPGPEGAVLALPNGSTVFEARNLDDFRNYAARHAVSWYKYLKKTRGRAVPNGALYFVTACIKSKSWGIAAFYPGETDGNSIQFVCDGGSYKWMTSGRTIARMGPSSQSSTSSDELNQCIFLTGYKIMLREDLWESLKTEVSVPTAEDQHSEVRIKTEGTCNSNKNSSSGSSTGAQDHNKSEGNTSTSNRCLERSDVMIDGDLLTSLPQYNPSDFINIALLESEPRARVALVHDTQWKGALPEHFTVDPSSKQIAQMLWNVTQAYEAVLDKLDCIYLVRKDDLSNSCTRYPGDYLACTLGTQHNSAEFNDVQANRQQQQASNNNTSQCVPPVLFSSSASAIPHCRATPLSSIIPGRSSSPTSFAASPTLSRPASLLLSKPLRRPKPNRIKEAKSGCYTCRIRRKKCDEQKTELGGCKTCDRLRLECLGYGVKRPDWLRESQAITDMRNRIKTFLASQGKIKGHAGSTSRDIDQDSSFLILRPDRHGSPESETSTSMSDYHRSVTPELTPDLYHGPPQALDAWSPYPSQYSIPSSQCHSGSSFLPQVAYDDPYSIVEYEQLQEPSGPTQNMWTIPHWQPATLYSILDPVAQYYITYVFEVQYLLANQRHIKQIMLESLHTQPASKELMQILSELHYGRRRLPQRNDNVPPILHYLKRTGTGRLDDAMAALHSVSVYLFNGGDGAWDDCIDFAAMHVQMVLGITFYNISNPLQFCDAKTAFVIKTAVWFDVLASITTEKPPRLQSVIDRLFNPKHNVQELADSLTDQCSMLSPMGCENDVVWAISEISALADWKRQQENGCLSVRELVVRASAIEQYLDNPTCNQPCRDELDMTLQCSASSIFRAAAHLYLATVVSGDFPLVPDVSTKTQMMYDAILATPPWELQPVVRSTVFAFFLCGCFLTDPERQKYIRGMLLLQSTEIGNVSSIVSLLDTIWAMSNKDHTRAIPWRSLLQEKHILLV